MKPKKPPPMPMTCNNEIEGFIHCSVCIGEVMSGQAPGESPESYARFSVGWTPRGLQLWCVRHDCNIANIDFEGHQHPANTDKGTTH